MIDASLYDRARKLDPRAAEQILGAIYPTVHRLAHTLTGREEIARKVVRAIIRRGLDRMPAWRAEGDAERWFLHHTVLLTRRLSPSEPEPADDILVKADPAASPQYMAFVRALRKLSPQMREAIVLHHAEQLDARQLAVAMDCSTEAAANHLAAGRRTLLAVVGSDLNVMLGTLARVYQSLTPQESIALPMLRRSIRRFVWPRRMWGMIRAAATIALILAIAYLVYTYGPILDY